MTLKGSWNNFKGLNLIEVGLNMVFHAQHTLDYNLSSFCLHTKQKEQESNNIYF